MTIPTTKPPSGTDYARSLGVTPTRWANYPGNVVDSVGDVKGPNTLGEWLTAVGADYDPATDVTRVGFAFGIRCCECGKLVPLTPKTPADAAADSTQYRVRIRCMAPRCAA
jgi:hypothetical protein